MLQFRPILRMCTSCHLSRAAFSTSSKYFDKILVANRGEIACRVMRTARRLGIGTVAVFSEADEKSKHVKMADEAICVGPAPSTQSYLAIDRILEAAKQTGAQAVHPGYGFLSENSIFAERVEQEGLTFIGPASKAISLMGDKLMSKKLARKANVNIIPGFLGEVKTVENVLSVAHEIGYPIMIKASAGGGGKGMRIAWNDEEAATGFRVSKDEAKSSFGDDRMIIEKYVDEPRHIEIQVLADTHGNCLYFPERECSIQRRNQKVIEEAPSSFIDEDTRRLMGEQAVRLAKAVNYRSAGTVEMLVDSKRNFYFLEMNTRLQVEHPVTEYITGVDLVEEMIRVAAGNKLSMRQEDISIRGWATEARVYAEDPLRGFVPSAGTLIRYKEPLKGNSNVRCDSGVFEGAKISVHYDPMISKLIAYGVDRQSSISLMSRALDEYVIDGIAHNIPLLRTMMDNERYKKGKITTKLIDEEWPDGFNGCELDERKSSVLMACAALMQRQRESLLQKLNPNIDVEDKASYVVAVEGGNSRCPVDISMVERDVAVVTVDGKSMGSVRIAWDTDSIMFRASFNEGRDEEDVVVQLLDRNFREYSLRYMGNMFKVSVRTAAQDALLDLMPVHTDDDTSNMIRSPMPGKVISTAVKAGDKVFAGQEIVVIEAMKMQNILRATSNGIVKEVRVTPGHNVAADELLVLFEDTETTNE